MAITDAIRAYERALSAPKGLSAVYNISSGNFTIGEIGKTLAHTIDSKYGITANVEVDAKPSFRNYRVSTEKAVRELGLDFNGSIESITDDLYEHLGTNLENSNDDLFYNVRTFKKLLDARSIANLI